MDDRTLLVRRGGAAVVVLIVLVLIVLGIKALLDNAQLQAFRSYATSVNQIAADAHSNTRRFFTALTHAPGLPSTDFDLQLQEYTSVAQSEASSAAALSVPAQLVGAQHDLLLALDMRAEAFRSISGEIDTALSGHGVAKAFDLIAGEMQKFLASDVIYSQRVVPLVSAALSAQGIRDLPVASSSVLAGNTSWLSPVTVTQRVLGYTLASQGGTNVPGSNGHALSGVSVGGVTLTPGNSLNSTLTYRTGMQFTLSVLNTGAGDVHDATAEIWFSGAGLPSRDLLTSVTIPETFPGQTTLVTIPLALQPPLGRAVRLHAEVVPLPGETDDTNNRLSFVVQFR